MGVPTFVASAEEAIISKLEWAKLASSERQIHDAAGVVKTLAGKLDTDYIEHWVEALDLREQWAKAKANA